MRIFARMAGDFQQIFRRLWPLALVALFAEWGYAIMNVGALPIYLSTPRPNGLGAPTSLVGLIISTFLVSETMFKAFFGWAGDRYGRKGFIVTGLCMSAVSPILMRMTRRAWVFFPVRAFDGVGAAALWPSVFASVAALTTEDERNGAMSVFNMMYMVGIAMALPSYSFAMRLAGRQKDVFYLISALFLVSALVAFLTVPQTRDPANAGQAASHSGGATAVAEPLGWREVLELAVESRVLRTMMIASLLQALGTNLLNGIISIYVHARLGIRAEQLGNIFIGPGIAVVLMALPLGWLGGRLGKVRSVRVGLATAAIAMALIPYMRTVTGLSLIIIPVVIGFLIASPAWLALVTQIAPQGQQGLIVGSVATAQGLGAMAGPALGGWLYEQFVPEAPFHAAAVALVLALLITLFRFDDKMKIELPVRAA